MNGCQVIVNIIMDLGMLLRNVGGRREKIWIPKIPQTHAENIIAPVNDITIATETTVDNTVNTVATQQQNSEEDVDQEGFQRALKPSMVMTSNVSLINTENHFQALDRSEGQNTGGIVVQQEQ